MSGVWVRKLEYSFVFRIFSNCVPLPLLRSMSVKCELNQMLAAILWVRERNSQTHGPFSTMDVKDMCPPRHEFPLLPSATSASCVQWWTFYLSLHCLISASAFLQETFPYLETEGQAKLSVRPKFQGQPRLHWRNREWSRCGQAGLVCLFYYFFSFSTVD